MTIRRRSDGCYAKGTPIAVRLYGRTRLTESGCLEFVGGRDEQGYGTIRKAGGGMTKAHRLAWEMRKGTIPAGQCVLHRCDNPACVNVDHLFLGTVSDNNADRASKGRSKGTFRAGPDHPATKRSGERHWRAKVSDAQVAEMRRLYNGGASQTEIARLFGINAATVSRIVRGVWR